MLSDWAKLALNLCLSPLEYWLPRSLTIDVPRNRRLMLQYYDECLKYSCTSGKFGGKEMPLSSLYCSKNSWSRAPLEINLLKRIEKYGAFSIPAEYLDPTTQSLRHLPEVTSSYTKDYKMLGKRAYRVFCRWDYTFCCQYVDLTHQHRLFPMTRQDMIKNLCKILYSSYCNFVYNSLRKRNLLKDLTYFYPENAPAPRRYSSEARRQFKLQFDMFAEYLKHQDLLKDLFGPTEELPVRITTQKFVTEIMNPNYLNKPRYQRVPFFLLLKRMISFVSDNFQLSSDLFLLDVYEFFREQQCSVLLRQSQDRPINWRINKNAIIRVEMLPVEHLERNAARSGRLLSSDTVSEPSSMCFASNTIYGPNFDAKQRQQIKHDVKEMKSEYANGTETTKFLFNNPASENLLLVIYRSYRQHVQLTQEFPHLKQVHFKPVLDRNSGLVKKLAEEDKFIVARSAIGVAAATKKLFSPEYAGLLRDIKFSYENAELRKRLEEMVHEFITLRGAIKAHVNFYASKENLVQAGRVISGRIQGIHM